MRSSVPTIHCDDEDGDCGNWDVDNYKACVSSVNGVRVTAEQRAPGWVSSPTYDFCPEHAPAPKEN